MNLPERTAELRRLRREAARALQEYGEGNPKYQTAVSELRQAEKELLPDPGDSQGVTAYLQQLKDDLARIRKQEPGYSLDAWLFYFNESERLGRSLTDLPQHSHDEEVRFFARVVYGTDGHAYWLGGKDFKLNGNQVARPARWWWRREHGELTKHMILRPNCGQPHCIAPEHQHALLRRSGSRRYTEIQLIGVLQAVALKLGHTPSRKWWKQSGQEPGSGTFEFYFGGWNGALLAAGLKLNEHQEVTAEDCLRGIRYARKLLGHWPNYYEYLGLKQELKAKGFPTSMHPINRLHGSWVKAREKARYLEDSKVKPR